MHTIYNSNSIEKKYCMVLSADHHDSKPCVKKNNIYFNINININIDYLIFLISEL